ncbi:hypothetical protein BC629DRAFT_934923 [Irpex lacteus]|nr:hypothetical protein BC629DRAFT_934923 [Irpex lacteus]
MYALGLSLLVPFGAATLVTLRSSILEAILPAIFIRLRISTLIPSIRPSSRACHSLSACCAFLADSLASDAISSASLFNRSSLCTSASILRTSRSADSAWMRYRVISSLARAESSSAWCLACSATAARVDESRARASAERARSSA